MENQTEKREASNFSPPASSATPDPRFEAQVGKPALASGSPASRNQEASVLKSWGSTGKTPVVKSPPLSALHLSGIILAGGRSSRMGEDKALLTIGGVPMLRIVCDVAIALCETVYVVTPWTERYEHLLSQECEFIREVPLYEELGALKRAEGSEEDFNPKSKIQNLKSKSQLPITNSPLVGFAQGLSHVKTEWVLLLACDLPRLRVEVLRHWATLLDSVDSKAIALLTHQDKGWNPLCGFYRRSCQSGLTEYINSGGRSFQGWLAQHSVQVLPLPDAQMLFNCNTPADYEEIRRN